MVNADDSTAETVEGASGEDEDAKTQANRGRRIWANSDVNIHNTLDVILLQMTPSNFTRACLAILPIIRWFLGFSRRSSLITDAWKFVNFYSCRCCHIAMNTMLLCYWFLIFQVLRMVKTVYTAAYFLSCCL